MKLLVLGNVVAFVVALLAIRLFVGFVAKYGFRAFGIYRIIAGGILLIMLALNLPLQPGIMTKTLADFDFETGEVLLLDKPLTWTSFDVVRKVKNTLRIKKIGHAGTLDPLATGLLILCTGKKTKEIDLIQAQEKEYTGTFRLGETTPSFDLETAVDLVRPYAHLTDEEIAAATLPFIGLIRAERRRCFRP